MDADEKKALQEKIYRHLNTRVSEAAHGVQESSRTLFRQIEELSEELGRRLREGSAEAAATLADELASARGAATKAAERSSALADELASAKAAATRAAERSSGLARSVSTVLGKKDQLSVLQALLDGALFVIEGAVIFVLKDENIGGWRSGGRIEEQQAKTVHFPFVSSNSVVRTLRQGDAVCVTGEFSRSDRKLFDDLGAGQPAGFVAVPLVIRGRAQAVLLGANFSKSSKAPGQGELEVYQALAAAATSAIRNIQGRPGRERGEKRPAASPAVERVARKPARPVPPPPPSAKAAEKAVEPPVPVKEERPRERVLPRPAPAADRRPVRKRPAPGGAEKKGKPRSPWFTPTTRNSNFGSKGDAAERTKGLGLLSTETEDDDRKTLSVEEKELHDDARRFARLLVSEIKLYNEAKVTAGRQEKDLYQRLRTDIERSRQMYNERVPPSIAAKTNYFMDELVSILAEGDRSTLGM